MKSLYPAMGYLSIQLDTWPKGSMLETLSRPLGTWILLAPNHSNTQFEAQLHLQIPSCN